MNTNYNPQDIMMEMMGTMPSIKRDVDQSPTQASAPIPENNQDQPSPPKAETPSLNEKQENEKVKRMQFCCQMTPERIATVKAIAEKENVNIYSIVECGLDLFFEAYKQKNGSIPKSRKSRRRSASSLV